MVWADFDCSMFAYCSRGVSQVSIILALATSLVQSKLLIAFRLAGS
jgi:hypothetical protein